MAVTLEEAAATARDLMGSVSREASDWNDNWFFRTAQRRQFGGNTCIIDKETGEDLSGLPLEGTGITPRENPEPFQLPEGLYDEPFG